MNVFKKVFKKVGVSLGLVPDNKTDEIMEERSEIKKTMATNLKAIGFSDSEIEEVLDVITKAETAIQIQKDNLIGTNINTYDPNPAMKEIFDEIRKIQLQSAEDVKSKIAEIKARKGM
ncbi:MAG: hypothetical protein E7Z90_05715 [Cyanobacteria bacterium SIG29]|nr:hypothetical protein [Cyanobacteria bacterium SIG29]